GRHLDGGHLRLAATSGLIAPATPRASGTCATVSVITDARVLGIASGEARNLARRGAFPCDVIETGKGYRVPFTGLLGLLRSGAIQTTRLTDPPTTRAEGRKPR